MKKALSLAINPSAWKNSLENWRKQQRIMQIARSVAQQSEEHRSGQQPDLQPSDGLPAASYELHSPVVFFNATARLGSLSQNAAFSLLSSWGLRLSGTQVIHFVCQRGLQPCVLGTNREDHTTPPPCNSCIALSRQVFAESNIRTFQFQVEPDLAARLESLNVEALCSFSYLPAGNPFVFDSNHEGSGETAFRTDTKRNKFAEISLVEIPLGRLVLPAARWALRRYDLDDTPQIRYLLRQYILSAFSTILQFDRLIQETNPSAAVIFNGIMYPEASARWVAQQRGLRVITHEVGFQRFSAFFSEGDATAYPIEIPPDFELNPEQNIRIDTYLEKRFQGQFTMAGIRFWPEMRGLDQVFLEKAGKFRQIVPIFTNVVYDTSQIHANVVFPHMFAWLNLLLEIIKNHPDTLFVIRAHPDEMRPGTAKQSRQTVRDWVKENLLLDGSTLPHGRSTLPQLPNFVFIDSLEYISSYELIQKSKFVIVYNSSIGLEAALMGKPVLCGGKARYTQYPIVFFPANQEAYRKQADEFLDASSVAVPAEFQRNGRRFLYYQLYRASLSFEQYLETGQRAGFVYLKPFDIKYLLPENSPTIQTLVRGISTGSDFLQPEEVLS